jgi:hypothetical protein
VRAQHERQRARPVPRHEPAGQRGHIARDPATMSSESTSTRRGLSAGAPFAWKHLATAPRRGRWPQAVEGLGGNATRAPGAGGRAAVSSADAAGRLASTASRAGRLNRTAPGLVGREPERAVTDVAPVVHAVERDVRRRGVGAATAAGCRRRAPSRPGRGPPAVVSRPSRSAVPAWKTVTPGRASARSIPSIGKPVGTRRDTRGRAAPRTRRPRPATSPTAAARAPPRPRGRAAGDRRRAGASGPGTRDRRTARCTRELAALRRQHEPA